MMPPPRDLLDTSAYARLRQGHEEVVTILAAALDSGAHLGTFDGDFEHVPGFDWTLLR